MQAAQRYVLGASERAARRLEIQDAHFAVISEALLDDLAIKPGDRVVELGCGAGGMSKRILKRLSEKGVLVGVDCTAGLLEQAKKYADGVSPARFEAVLGDLTSLGPWLDGADVLIGRAVLHHVPMAELFLGKLRLKLKPGTRIGFQEPDFRSPLGLIGYLEAQGRAELEPLRVWAMVINKLYNANDISPAVGATLARTLETAGYQNVCSAWHDCPSNPNTLENMLMFYDEVRDRLDELGILTKAEADRQQRLLTELMTAGPLPATWGAFRVSCEA